MSNNQMSTGFNMFAKNRKFILDKVAWERMRSDSFSIAQAKIFEIKINWC